MPSARGDHVYFPAIVRHECDCPVDALVYACVSRSEAMNLVVASWFELETACLLTSIDGGRKVVVMRAADERWVACNPYLSDLCATLQDAEKYLRKRLRPSRRGVVVRVATAVIEAAMLCQNSQRADDQSIGRHGSVFPEREGAYRGLSGQGRANAVFL